MNIGVDFDNTLVCYDQVFHRAALEKGLIEPELPANKGAVRDYLRACDREDDWTELQGYVYGCAIQTAEPFPGAIEFFKNCKAVGIPTQIVSHKTRHPYKGEQYDLHQAARGWLNGQGFLDPAITGLSDEDAWFELTKESKLQRIGLQGCTHFIDDLPEFLAEPNFPEGVKRILFDPNDKHADGQFRRMTSWQQIADYILDGGV